MWSKQKTLPENKGGKNTFDEPRLSRKTNNKKQLKPKTAKPTFFVSY